MALRKRRTTRRSVSRSGRRKVSRPWSRSEIAFMRKFYRNHETKWVARQMGRTVYSVRYKAVDLRIKKAAPSVWKGNKGSKHAFKKAGGGHSITTGRRSVSRRRPTSGRRYSTTSRRRTTRKSGIRRKKRARR